MRTGHFTTVPASYGTVEGALAFLRCNHHHLAHIDLRRPKRKSPLYPTPFSSRGEDHVKIEGRRNYGSDRLRGTALIDCQFGSIDWVGIDRANSVLANKIPKLSGTGSRHSYG